jgi:hypothetical protein
VLVGGGLALVAVAALIVVFPWILVAPVAVAAAWLGITLVVNGAKLHRAPEQGEDRAPESTGS